MSLSITDNISVNKRVANIDTHYGPYNDKAAVITALVGDESRILAENGLTVGINENGEIVDYVFQNIMSGQTPTTENLIRKINDTRINVYQGNNDSDQNKQLLGYFTLNQKADGSIDIYIPIPDVDVDQTYDASSTKPQSGTAVAGAIANFITKVTSATQNNIPKFGSDGTLADSGYNFNNLVFMGSTVENREVSVEPEESQETTEE